MPLRTAEYRATLQAEARRLMLPPWTYASELFSGSVWLEGLVLHESGGDPHAYHLDKQDPVVLEKDKQIDASYGLMQVEGRTALGHIKGGLEAWIARPFSFDFLYFPLENLAHGLRNLMTSLAVADGNTERALAFYNGGVWGMAIDPKNKYRLNDQPYVNAVLEATRKVFDDR